MKLTRRALFAALAAIGATLKAKPIVIRDAPETDTIALTIRDIERLDTINGPGQDAARELIFRILPFFPDNSFPQPLITHCHGKTGVCLTWWVPRCWRDCSRVEVVFYSGVGGLRTKRKHPSVQDHFVTHATPATLARELRKAMEKS